MQEKTTENKRLIEYPLQTSQQNRYSMNMIINYSDINIAASNEFRPIRDELLYSI